MNIYYLYIPELEKNSLIASYTDNKDFMSEKRLLEYAAGRFLVKTVAKIFYAIEDEIVLNNKKPEFKNKDIEFSLSHSKDYVVAVFDDKPCGIDIEYIKDRDFSHIGKRYNEIFTTREDFYKFWTQKESEIKLPNCAKKNSFVFKKNYMISVASFDRNMEVPKCINLIKYI